MSCIVCPVYRFLQTCAKGWFPCYSCLPCVCIYRKNKEPLDRCYEYYSGLDSEIDENQYLVYPPIPDLKPTKACKNENKFDVSLEKTLLHFVVNTILCVVFIIACMEIGAENDDYTFFLCDGLVKSEALFCYARPLIIIVTTLCLLPQLLDAGAVTGVMLISTGENVYVSLYNGKYVGYAPYLSECLNADILKRSLFCTQGLISFTRGLSYQSGDSCIFISNMIYAFILMIPMLALSLLFIPLNIIILLSIKNLETLILTAALIQYSAYFLNTWQLLNARERVGELLMLYTRMQLDGVRAVHYPERQHDMETKQNNGGLLRAGAMLPELHAKSWRQSWCGCIQPPPYRQKTYRTFYEKTIVDRWDRENGILF